MFLGSFSLLSSVKLGTFARIAIDKARVARLATADDKGQPYLVPVVFVFDQESFFIPLDEKSKKVRPEKLRRVRNIQKNPNIALLIDEYSGDWRKLFFVMILGKASIIGKGQVELLSRAHKLLYAKYPQYRRVGIGELCIMIKPQKITSWRNR